MTNYPLWDQLNQLKEAQWVDLTHTFDPEIPRFSEFEKVKYRHSLTSKNMVSTFNDGVSLHNMVRISTRRFILWKIEDT